MATSRPSIFVRLLRRVLPAAAAPGETAAPPAGASELPPVLDPGVLDRLGEETDVSLLPELVGTFLEHGRDRCRAIAEADAAGDLQRLREDAHALKSSAATFGAVRLSRQAADLESAAGAGEAGPAGAHATAIAATVPPTWEALEAYVAALPAARR